MLRLQQITSFVFASISALCFSGLLRAQIPFHSVIIVPESPTAFDTVIARVTTPTCFLDPDTARVSQNAGSLRVDVRYVPGCVLTGGSFTAGIMLGQLPPGSYSVGVFASPTALAASAQFSVADAYPSKAVPHPLINYTDWWWTTQEAGWGLSILQHTSDRIFAGWFVYDQSKRPVWYTLQPGNWTNFNKYVGPVYTTTGPYFGGPFDQSQVGITQVGTATLSFSDFANGTFTYTVDGVTGTKQITRLSF
jgi:hypothetical protein